MLDPDLGCRVIDQGDTIEYILQQLKIRGRLGSDQTEPAMPGPHSNMRIVLADETFNDITLPQTCDLQTERPSNRRTRINYVAIEEPQLAGAGPGEFERAR